MLVMYYCQSLQKNDVYSTVSNGKVELDSTCMLNDIVYLGRCKSGTMYFCRHNWAFDKLFIRRSFMHVYLMLTLQLKG